jgi:hypothetical protein
VTDVLRLVLGVFLGLTGIHFAQRYMAWLDRRWPIEPPPCCRQGYQDIADIARYG